MHNDLPDPTPADFATPPPPPPPPPPARRKPLLSRRAATAALAGGLVVGGAAGGYIVSQAATTATPTPSATAPAHPGPGFPGGDPAARTTDLQQAAAAIGISETQLQTELTAGKTIAAVAAEHNVSATTVISALVPDENAEIDAAVAAGKVTAAQAAQMKAQTTQRVTDFVNGTQPAHGPGGPHGGAGLQSEDEQVVATAIGITTTQLQTELTAGKTIAAIATEHNVATSKVIDALVTSENAEIDQQVTDGHITAAQAAQMKTQTTQRVTDAVKGTHPAGGPGGPGGWRGHDGPPPTAPTPAVQ